MPLYDARVGSSAAKPSGCASSEPGGGHPEDGAARNLSTAVRWPLPPPVRHMLGSCQARLVGPRSHVSDLSSKHRRRPKMLAACWTVFVLGLVLALAEVIPAGLGAMLSGVALIAMRPGPMARMMKRGEPRDDRA